MLGTAMRVLPSLQVPYALLGLDFLSLLASDEGLDPCKKRPGRGLFFSLEYYLRLGTLMNFRLLAVL
jgi:hypothetical protein